MPVKQLVGRLYTPITLEYVGWLLSGVHNEYIRLTLTVTLTPIFLVVVSFYYKLQVYGLLSIGKAIQQILTYSEIEYLRTRGLTEE